MTSAHAESNMNGRDELNERSKDIQNNGKNSQA
jgi:hypothetical protein